MSGPCPTPERLAAALRGLQRSDDDADFAAHLADCTACQVQLEALAGGSGWLEAKARTHAATVQSAAEPLRKAMQVLESRSCSSESEAPAAPELDFLQPSDEPGMLGRFGPYAVIAHVATGGMGIVLKARDPALDRIVALKILPPALAANALARARFVREARAAAAVVHEHVVPIYAVDECAGLPYLVMQFVQGRTLSERIRKAGPLRLEEILRIGGQTAAGLAAAHAQGLVHRDVKPSNILLENSVERVRLTDFGLARAVDDAGLTRTGELAGTPEYMAPEHAGNEAVDHRSDLFSFGSALYTMCTGCSPFQGNSVVAVIRKVCDEQPPAVHEINAAIPRWMSEIVAKLMAKTPAERFQSAHEVAELLEHYLSRVQRGELGALPDHRARSEPVRRRLKLLYALGAATVLSGVGLLTIVLMDRRTLPSTAKPQGTSQVPFVVRNAAGEALGSYADVIEAIRAAPSSGVIELRWNGQLQMPMVRLAAKSLTFRAAATFHPVWLHTNPSESALATDAALTLEGIDFLLNPIADNPSGHGETPGPRPGGRAGSLLSRQQGSQFEPNGISLISITGASLKISHCIVQLEAPDRGRLRGLACITLENAATCELKSTALYATPGKAIVWRPRPAGLPSQAAGPASDGAFLSLSNCVVSGAPAFWMDLSETSHTPLRIVRCTFLGPTILYFPLNAPTADVVVVAQHNLFAAGTVLRDARKVTSPSPTAAIHWQERENLFCPGRNYIALSAYAREAPAATTLADWNKWWMQNDQNSRQVEVTFAGDRGDINAGTRRERDLSAFKVADLRVVEGPPLERTEWARFGADTANIGPASAE